MMRQWKKILVMTLLGGGVVGFLSGCATIMQGTTQNVGISSNPTGATVTVNGRSYGQTPVVADLKRKDNHVVRISLDGFEPFEATLSRSVSGWVAGNIIFGGILGLVVDAASGGMYKLSPEQIAASMHRTVAVEAVEDTLFIAVVLTPDPSWEKVGSLTPVK